jgi:predicted dehydrogenase
MARLNVALVGAGNIAARYAACIAAQPALALAGATDLVAARADKLVTEHGGRAYATLDAVLADDAVDVVVNLTVPSAHEAVTRLCLEAGKHVHAEKPLALHGPEARALAEYAAEQGVRLSCAPATLLGEAQQTAWKLVRDGSLGRVRTAYAEANWGRIERWHPGPESLYEVGPLVDVAVYPITIFTAMFGPAQRVTAFATTLQPERKRLDGVAFPSVAPDFHVAVLELEDGVVARVTASFWVGARKQRGVELHGDEASLWLEDFAHFDSRLERTEDGDTYTPVPLPRPAYRGTDWARPLVDLAEALADDRPHRMGAEHAVHVVEVLDAARVSSTEGRPVELTSGFPRPEPLDWAQ